MRILKNIKRFRDLRRLKAAAEQTPSPQTICTLAEAHIAAGHFDEAHRIAKQGASRFPASESLAGVCRFVNRQRQSAEISAIRAQIDKKPEPGLLRRLAEIHLALGEADRALALCEQSLELFPLYEHAHLLIGQVRLARFLESRIAQDGIEAERQFRRALKLDPRNERAATLLALLYFVTGARRAMVEVLEASLIATPGRSDLSDLAQAAGSPRLWERAVELKIEDELEEDERDSFAELIRVVEMRSAFRNSPHHFPVDPLGHAAVAAASYALLDNELLAASVKATAALPGVRNLVALSEKGEPLAEYMGDRGLSPDEFSQLTEGIGGHSDEATRRMDLGTFQWCSIEGPFGGLTVTRTRDLFLGLFHGLPIRAEKTPALLEKIASQSFVAPREVGRA